MAKKMLQTVRNAGLAGLFYSTFYSAKLLQAFVFACLAGVSYSIFCSVKTLRVAFSGRFEGVLSLPTHLWREMRGSFLAGVTLFSPETCVTPAREDGSAAPFLGKRCYERCCAFLEKGAIRSGNMCNMPLACCYTFILEKGVTSGVAFSSCRPWSSKKM